MLKHKRLVSIIATIAFCLSFLAPALLAPAPAVAASTYTALSIPNVTDNAWSQLGTILVEASPSSIANTQVLTLTLPEDFRFFDDTVANFKMLRFAPAAAGDPNQYIFWDDQNNDNLVTAGERVYLTIDVPSTYGGDPNDMYGGAATTTGTDIFSVSTLSDREIQLVVQNYTDNGNQNVFRVYLNNTWVKDGFSGDITVNASAPSTSGFSEKDVVVGRVPGGKVQITVPSVKDFNNEADVTMRVREVTAGSIDNVNDSLKLILPSGYEFASFAVAPAGYAFLGGSNRICVKEIWGNNSIVWGAPTVSADRDEIDLNVTTATTQASNFEFLVKIAVADESQVDFGDVKIRFRGESETDVADLIVAKYTDFGVTIKPKAAEQVYAGKTEQAIADFTIKENVGETLTHNRYITLELPSYAKWTDIPGTIGPNNGITLTFAGLAGSKGNIIKYNVTNTAANNGPAELKFEDMEVALDVCAPGELKVKVGGNAAQFTDNEFTVANIAFPVVAKAESTPSVKIGSLVKVGDLTLTETVAGAIEKNSSIILKVPAGVEFVKDPKVEVTSGDLRIDSQNILRYKNLTTNDYTDFYKYLVIPTKASSNDVSSIKVSDIYLKMDRTVPEGDLAIAVLGAAVLESNSAKNADFAGGIVGGLADIDNDGTGDYSVATGIFPATQAVAAPAVAVIDTPAQGGGAVSFYVGSQVFTIDNSPNFMDAAPYIKAGRTYVPVRYLANALGVTDENVQWDNANKTVTLTKGDQTIILVVGSKTAKVNGADVALDVAPENNNGRIMLPARAVAEGFGYQVGWNPALGQVLIW